MQEPCPQGTYTDVTGTPNVTACKVCPAGYYCTVGTTSPVDCPRGSFCVEGVEKPSPCPIGRYGNSTSEYLHASSFPVSTVGISQVSLLQILRNSQSVLCATLDGIAMLLAYSSPVLPVILVMCVMKAPKSLAQLMGSLENSAQLEATAPWVCHPFPLHLSLLYQ